MRTTEIEAQPGNDGWPTFDDMLARFPAPEPWMSAGDDDGFFRAAVEASEFEGGSTLLVAPQPLSFDASLTVRYVGEGSSKDGCIFHALIFEGAQFDAFMWIEDDLRRARLVWRGSEDEFVRAELMLRMFERETLAHLR